MKCPVCRSRRHIHSNTWYRIVYTYLGFFLRLSQAVTDLSIVSYTFMSNKCVHLWYYHAEGPFGNAYNLEHKCWCPIVVKSGYFFKFGQVYTRFLTLRQLYARSEWSILPSIRLKHAYLWVASPLGGAPHPTRWLSPPWVEESSKNGPENAVFRAKNTFWKTY